MKSPVNDKAFMQGQTKKGIYKQNNTSAFAMRVRKFVLFCTSAILIYLTSSVVYADKILVLGDSLSAAYKIPWESGWVQILADDLSGQHEVINASVSGETTGGGLARLPALLEEYQPDWVIIELGGNDGLRGLPLDLIRNNLTEMASISLETNVKPIFFGVRIPPNYGQRYNDAFASIFPEVAAEFEAPYLDFYLKEIATSSKMMQEDKIHPSEMAQPIIKDAVFEFLEKILK